MSATQQFADDSTENASPILRQDAGDPIVLLHGNPTSSYSVAPRHSRAGGTAGE